MAGSLYAINFQYIAPGSVFDFQLSLSIVLMPIIGGLGDGRAYNVILHAALRADTS